MSLGSSNKSKYGRESEFWTGRFSKVSGELAATELSLERNGSLGFIGGMGILTFAFALMEQKAANFRVFLALSDDEEVADIEIGNCKLVAIWIYRWDFVTLLG